MAYEINYEDKRFQEVESDKKEALSDLEKTYSDMTNESDKFYQAQIDASQQWADTQQKNQQAQTDFAIEKIEQQKEQAEKDYIKEQSGAYVDWQKESNRYGANNEQLASQGLTNTGYSESSQVSLYNTYQNRVMAARDSYNRAVLDYDNAIKDARLQNNSLLAEIAYEALQKKLELSLQGFQYKNQLILDKTAKKMELDNTYYARYQDVLNQINTENAMQEQIRQYNATLALQREQFEWQKAQAAAKSSGGSGGSSRSSSGKSGSSSVNKSQTSTSKDYIKTVTTYEEAAKYMRDKGVATGDGGLMTKNEWLRRKSSGSNAGEVQYSSYASYLNNFVRWRMDNPQ